MKFSYSLIKKLLPKVPASGKLIEGLNMHSFEVEAARDDVLEIKLPANRYSDASSHIGIAREAAAIFNLRFKDPVKTLVNLPAGRGILKIKVQDKDLCPRYAARYFEIDKIGTSPPWLKKVLTSSGIQSINSVVDIMNYAMLVTGQPMHAFDAKEVVGNIVVRRAKKGEKITTLDNRNLELGTDVLLIADEKKPLAIAGIKGGKEAGVTKNTKQIIIEAANFNSTSVWKAARALKLQTDAGLRFSHDLSPALVDRGMDFATELLKNIGARLKDSLDVYSKKAGSEIIPFHSAKYERLIGIKADLNFVKKYFAALGFEFDGKKARIPAWRTDVQTEEDLAEELSRFVGYGKLRPSAPFVSIKPSEIDEEFSFSERTRNFLVRFGFDEVYNSSFVGEKELKEFEPSFFGSNSLPMELENPISEDKKFLRKNLYPLLLKNIEDNSRFFEKIRIFELGKVFGISAKKRDEKLSLGFVVAGKNDKSVALELKGAIDELLKSFGLSNFEFIEGRGGLRVFVDQKEVGYIAVLSSIKRAKNWQGSIGEIDASELLKIVSEEHAFKPLSKYPEIARDISFMADSDVRIGEIIGEIYNVNTLLIEDVDLMDEYTDEKFGNRQSLTLRVIFQAEDRTLSDEEANLEMEKIAALLKEKFDAEIR